MAEHLARHADCGCSSTNLRYEPLNSGPIVVMQQQLDPFITAALDAVPKKLLPNLRLKGALPTLRAQLVHGIAWCGLEPHWLADWLVDNVMFQARRFVELTSADALRVRLETIADDGCSRFHTDNVRHRLLCTYRGPGTEWIDPKAAFNMATGAAIDDDSICQLERGAVALIRGSAGATPDRCGLIHRSPRIEGTGIARLLLAIDEDDRQ